ncbi:uncharacterized protein HMPREF1541_01899 [Cyphellophora europaea CBS 101466]|uniref:OmdA domain containing protein n=1 Tax=Cyphellophora europaea (strain CBS 101466) TaxID=1220924 RepID=W2S202_CYPE1|nr:uncharacterized protein HMPREF1541_01899 [Cyphellophora europaea CBS 101466]ETN42741.1 hypothetical protein HMPREF1541_01899 [Cyphellophora europaea CBS 101466]
MADTVRRQSTRLLQQTSTPVPTGIKKASITSSRAPKTAKASAITRPATKKLAQKAPKGAATISPVTQEQLLLTDASAFRAWLDDNENTSDGVWLVLAKKGTTSPTSLTRTQALDEALCSGWIDSQGKSLDAFTSIQRYTPRRAKSLWSAINVGHVARLREEGRMRERGEREVTRAKEDGRWERAYAGPSNMTIPDEVVAALRGKPVAKKRLDGMKNMERYSALLPIVTTHTEATRKRKIDKLVEELSKER